MKTSSKDYRLASRSIYLPKNRPDLTMTEHADVVVYRYSGAKFYALAFRGTAGKPAFHYSFKTEAAREECVQRFLEKCGAAAEYKAQRAAMRTAFVPSLQVGDVLVSRWGYDQTNVDFYEVVQASGKFVTVREIAQEREYDSDMTGACVPVPGRYIGEPVRKKVSDGNVIKMESWGRYASKHETLEVAPGVRVSQPVRWTAYA